MGTRGFLGYYRNGKKPGKIGVGAVGVYNHFDSYPTGLLANVVSVIQQNHKGNWEAFLKEEVLTVGGMFREHEDPPKGLIGKWDPLFIEWVYILHKDGIDVLAHRSGTRRDNLLGFKLLGEFHKTPGKGYGWWLVQENVPYEIGAPYIKEMEQRAYVIENAAEEKDG